MFLFLAEQRVYFHLNVKEHTQQDKKNVEEDEENITDMGNGQVPEDHTFSISN